MEFLLILPIAGLVLPPRYSLRLGAAGIVALLALSVYGNTPYLPGAGHALGEAILARFAILFFAAIFLGIVLRWLWNWWHRIDMTPTDLEAPLADQALAFLATVLPAGMAALWLGAALSGNTAPLRTHLLVLAGLAAVALGSLVLAKGVIRAGLLGFAAFLALIVADSMRLDRQIQAQLPKDTPYCLAIGPDFLSRDQTPPLMGLTAPKPILLVTDNQDRRETRRWSFRYHGFVRNGTSNAGPPCTPTLP